MSQWSFCAKNEKKIINKKLLPTNLHNPLQLPRVSVVDAPLPRVPQFETINPPILNIIQKSKEFSPSTPIMKKIEK